MKFSEFKSKVLEIAGDRYCTVGVEECINSIKDETKWSAFIADLGRFTCVSPMRVIECLRLANTPLLPEAVESE